MSMLISSVCVVPGSSDRSVTLLLRLCALAGRSYLLTSSYQLRLHLEIMCNLKCLYQLTGYIIVTYTHANCVFFCHYWLSIFSSRLLRLYTCSCYYIFRKWVRLSVSNGHCMTDTSQNGKNIYRNTSWLVVNAALVSTHFITLWR
jgi:hypothetical protein